MRIIEVRVLEPTEMQVNYYLTGARDGIEFHQMMAVMEDKTERAVWRNNQTGEIYFHAMVPVGMTAPDEIIVI